MTSDMHPVRIKAKRCDNTVWIECAEVGADGRETATIALHVTRSPQVLRQMREAVDSAEALLDVGEAKS